MVKQNVYIAVGPVSAKPGSQAERIHAFVKSTGQRGATKSDVCKALPDVIEKNVSYHLGDLLKRGSLGRLGDPSTKSKPVDLESVRLAALVAFEELVKAEAKAKELPLDADKAYELYVKLKPAFLGRQKSEDFGTLNEALSALRGAMCAIIKSTI